MISDGKTSLDTVTMQMNFAPVQQINTDLFVINGDYDNGTKKGIPKNKYKVQNVGHGVNDITVDLLTQQLTMRVSAKCLLADYKRGITSHTLDRVIDTITQTGYVQLDVQKVYDNAVVLSADTVNHIPIKDKYYEQLTAVPYSRMYDVTPYGRIQSSLVVKGKYTSVKYRQIHYDKIQELNKDTKSRKFLADVSARRLHKDFANTVRIESNFTSFENIRKYLNIPTNSLKNVLTATGQPNLKLFDKLTQSIDVRIVELFTQYTGMTLHNELKLRGIHGIINDFNGNWQLIEQYVRTRAKGHYRNGLLKNFQQAYKSMHADNSRNYVNIVNYIKSELQAVA